MSTADHNLPNRTLLFEAASMRSMARGILGRVSARSYNVVLFTGPGQQQMLFERNVPFRHDWEHVVTPVVDSQLGR